MMVQCGSLIHMKQILVSSQFSAVSVSIDHGTITKLPQLLWCCIVREDIRLSLNRVREII